MACKIWSPKFPYHYAVWLSERFQQIVEQQISDYSAANFAGEFLRFPLQVNEVLWMSFTSIGFCSISKYSLPMLYCAFFFGAFPKLWKALSCLSAVRPSVCPSARREYLGSQWKDFHEIRYLRIFRKPAKIIKVSTNVTKLMSTLYKNISILMEISRWIFRRMRNISGNVQKNQNTLYSITFFPKSCRCKLTL
jgi:hypothetical protein